MRLLIAFSVFPLLSGLCLDRPGCECKPKKVRKTKVSIIIGTNASSTQQLCSHAEVRAS